MQWVMVSSVSRLMAFKDPLDALFFFSYTERRSQNLTEGCIVLSPHRDWLSEF